MQSQPVHNRLTVRRSGPDRRGPAVRSTHRHCNFGATIVELLTAIGIISLLGAVLLPAVQQVRERARTTSCTNHLRQLITAVHSHETVHQRFPRGDEIWVDEQGRLHPSISIHVHLLPFIERMDLYDRFDFRDLSALNGEPPTTLSTANTALFHEHVALFVCPSDDAQAGSTNYRSCMGPDPAPSILNDGPGPFVVGRDLGPADFRDGLSQTAMLSERVVGDYDVQTHDPWRDVFLVSPPPAYDDRDAWIERCAAGLPVAPLVASHSFLGFAWFRGGPRHTSYNHVLTPNSTIPDCAASGPYPDGGPGIYSARSQHPGGVNVALADGSVRFIHEGIEIEIWAAIGTRNGREVVPEF